MPRSVDDIMNKELLAVRADLPAREALELLRSFGVGAAPILVTLYGNGSWHLA